MKITNRLDPERTLRVILARGEPWIRSFGYETPNALATMGPFLPVWLSPSGQDPLAGKTPSLEAHFLIDTGASVSGIAGKAACCLGIMAHRETQMSSATETSGRAVFRVRVTFGVVTFTGEVRSIPWDTELAEAPILDRGFDLLLDGAGGGTQSPVIGLLGRDFLRFATMIYDGPGGAVEIRMTEADVVAMESPQIVTVPGIPQGAFVG